MVLLCSQWVAVVVVRPWSASCEAVVSGNPRQCWLCGRQAAQSAIASGVSFHCVRRRPARWLSSGHGCACGWAAAAPGVLSMWGMRRSGSVLASASLAVGLLLVLSALRREGMARLVCPLPVCLLACAPFKTRLRTRASRGLVMSTLAVGRSTNTAPMESPITTSTGITTMGKVCRTVTTGGADQTVSRFEAPAYRSPHGLAVEDLEVDDERC